MLMILSESAEVFNQIADYSDSEKLASSCTVKADYLDAKALMDSGQYKEAGDLAGDKNAFLYKVYGYQEVMITAQCFFKNNGNCMRSKQAGSEMAQSGRMTLRDETKNNLYAESFCDLCHTVIYNGVPTSMLDKIKAETVKEILETKQCSTYTRGHHLTPID